MAEPLIAVHCEFRSNLAAVLAQAEQLMLARTNSALDALVEAVEHNLRDPDRRGGSRGSKTERRTDDENTVGIRSTGLESGGNKSVRHGGSVSVGFQVYRAFVDQDGHIRAGAGFPPHDKIAAMLEFGLAGNRPFAPVSHGRIQAWHIMKQVMGIR